MIGQSLTCPALLLVEKHKLYGKFKFSPVNEPAKQFLSGFKQEMFTTDDLKFLTSLGYEVIIVNEEKREA